MSTKQKFTMCNLVYGQLYPDLWLENQLKSLCDPTNLPALREKYDLEYVLVTDEETLQHITRHPNFMRLTQCCTVPVIKLTWPPDSDRFGSRYGMLVQMFQQVLPEVLAKNSWFGCWVADLVFAQHSLPKMLARLEQGHDAVFNVPIRSAADSVNPLLQRLPGAPTDLELFEMAYHNIHHLWVASQWDAPLFSKFPYSMLWNSGTGLVSHHFGITPIVFKPTPEMKAVRGGIDSDMPAFFKNPFWAEDWIDAAVAGVEPLSNGHYPPFLQQPSSVEYVARWALKATHPNQKEYLHRELYYPSQRTFNSTELAIEAARTARDIRDRMGELCGTGSQPG